MMSRKIWGITGIVITLVGCGGTTTQEEMMRKAIRRPKDDEEVVQPAASPPEIQTPPSVAGSAGKSTVESSDPPGTPPGVSTQPAETKSGEELGISPEITIKEFPPKGPIAENEAAYTERLDQIGQVFKKHIDEKRSLPAAAMYSGSKPLLSWRVHMLPLMGYNALYSQFALDEPWDSPTNRDLLEMMPREYYTGATEAGYTCVQVPLGSSTLFSGPRPTFAKRVEDGLGNTVMLVLVASEAAVPWTKPEEYKPKREMPTQGLAVFNNDHHLVVWGSGDVTRIATNAGKGAYNSMYTIDAGESFIRSDIEYTGAKTNRVASANSTSTPKVVPPSNSKPTPAGANTGTTDTASPVNNLSYDLMQIVRSRLKAGELDHTFDLLDLSLLVDAGDVFIGEMKWVPALKRPVIFPRVGIGVECPIGGRFGYDPEPFRYKSGGAPANRGTKISVVDKLLGDFGNEVYRMMEARQNAGSWGPWAQADFQANTQTRSGDEYSPRALRPGIEFLGNNSRKNLMDLAKTKGLDLILFFDVSRQRTARGAKHHTTRLTIFDVVKNEPIFQTDPVNNILTYVATQDPTKKNPLAIALNEFDKWVRNELVMEPLPALTPEQIRGRMAAASEDTEGTSWDFALEARLYFKLGLISRVEYEQWAETFTGIPLAEFTQAPEQELLETLLETRDPEFARLTREALETSNAPIKDFRDDDDD
ncbi:MAG: DUF1559 domain-containing protein [Planctomycetota bacterium]|nr:DUF1559 domain-containing protein [Planctomycetota bacterium]